LGFEEACAQKIELGTAVHLALDELQIRDLAFAFAVGPRPQSVNIFSPLVQALAESVTSRTEG